MKEPSSDVTLAPATLQAIRTRLPLIAVVPWVAIAAVYVLLPEYLALGTQIMVMILFALSLDLIVGYVGLVSLGHAAFFGAGAYAAGLLAVHAALDPILGLIAGAIAGAILGLASGSLILRSRGLTFLMLTLSVVFMLHEIANRAVAVTGGDDGLQGMTVRPILGLWRFDMFGHTAYIYAAIVLFVCWLALVFLVGSPFGRSLVGIRENPIRMRSIGAPIFRRLLAAYTISAAFAGAAGALSAQTTQFVALKSVSFSLSAEVLVMLILGGVGRLYGAFIGPAIYMVAQDAIAKNDPVFWTFWIGIILLIVTIAGSNGVVGAAEELWRKLREKKRGGAK
jgi:branched-chain amino acid transport system permease protein